MLRQRVHPHQQRVRRVADDVVALERRIEPHRERDIADRIDRVPDEPDAGHRKRHLAVQRAGRIDVEQAELGLSRRTTPRSLARIIGALLGHVAPRRAAWLYPRDVCHLRRARAANHAVLVLRDRPCLVLVLERRAADRAAGVAAATPVSRSTATAASPRRHTTGARRRPHALLARLAGERIHALCRESRGSAWSAPVAVTTRTQPSSVSGTGSGGLMQSPISTTLPPTTTGGATCSPAGFVHATWPRDSRPRGTRTATTRPPRRRRAPPARRHRSAARRPARAGRSRAPDRPS